MKTVPTRPPAARFLLAAFLGLLLELPGVAAAAAAESPGPARWAPRPEFWPPELSQLGPFGIDPVALPHSVTGRAHDAGEAARRATRLQAHGLGVEAATPAYGNGFDSPAAEAAALAARFGAGLSPEAAHALAGWDDLADPLRGALAGFIRSFSDLDAAARGLYDGSVRFAATGVLGTSEAARAFEEELLRDPPSNAAAHGFDAPLLSQAFAARLRFIDSIEALEDALRSAPALPWGGRPVQIPPALSIDLGTGASTYTQDYALLFDAGGDDAYRNNAGGNSLDGGAGWFGPGNGCAVETTRAAAALVDLGGDDRYGDATSPRGCGVTGGGILGLGFLFDAAGQDRYDASDVGTNGGGYFDGIGFLVDGEGDDAYTAGWSGTNGGGGSESLTTTASGLLLDQAGNDHYAAGSRGTNGGGYLLGRGALLDERGDDVYRGADRGSNGGGFVGVGLLVDGAGDDAYAASGRGTNGGADFGSASLLLDAEGVDTYADDFYVCTDCTVLVKGLAGFQADGPPSDVRIGFDAQPLVTDLVAIAQDFLAVVQGLVQDVLNILGNPQGFIDGLLGQVEQVLRDVQDLADGAPFRDRIERIVANPSGAAGVLEDLACEMGEAGLCAVWTSRVDDSPLGNNWADDLAVSPDGSRVFLAGRTFGPGNLLTGDYLTAALDAQTGATLWTRTLDHGAVDIGLDVAVAPAGDRVYVTGASMDAPDQEHFDFATVAYDPATGDELWVSRFNGPDDLHDFAYRVAPSPDGSRVYVTGASEAETAFFQFDAVTVAYDAVTGAQEWMARFIGPGDWHDAGYDVAPSPDGSRVFVAGWSWTSNEAQFDYLTLAYDAGTGAQVWSALLNGPANDLDYAFAGVEVSPDGDQVYAAGWSGFTATTVAYDAAAGESVWATRRADGLGQDLARSPNGERLYLAAVSDGNGFDYATLALDAATGLMQWDTLWSSPGETYIDVPLAIDASPDGDRVYVTGRSPGWPGYPFLGFEDTTGWDYATVAVDATTGEVDWASRLDTAASSNYGFAIGVAPDSSRVYVTGPSTPVDLFLWVDCHACPGGSIEVAQQDFGAWTVAYDSEPRLHDSLPAPLAGLLPALDG